MLAFLCALASSLQSAARESPCDTSHTLKRATDLGRLHLQSGVRETQKVLTNGIDCQRKLVTKHRGCKAHDT